MPINQSVSCSVRVKQGGEGIQRRRERERSKPNLNSLKDLK